MGCNSIWKFSDNSSLKEYTLIVPSVAVGNVGQLSCDLLISSLRMKKIASVWSPALVPVLGYDAYDLNSNNLVTSCEIYKSSAKNLLVLQLRSPLVMKYARLFLEDIVKVFQQKGVSEFIILTSSFSHEKKHVMSSPFRYIASDQSQFKNAIQKLQWTESELVDGKLKIYGGGFASMLFEIAVQKSMPAVILYKYCSEGDNIPDAYEMLNQLSLFLPLFSVEKDLLSQLVQPASWKFMFGRPPPTDIY